MAEIIPTVIKHMVMFPSPGVEFPSNVSTRLEMLPEWWSIIEDPQTPPMVRRGAVASIALTVNSLTTELVDTSEETLCRFMAILLPPGWDVDERAQFILFGTATADTPEGSWSHVDVAQIYWPCWYYCSGVPGITCSSRTYLFLDHKPSPAWQSCCSSIA